MYLWECYPAVLNVEVHVQNYRKKVYKESIVLTVLNQINTLFTKLLH